MTATSVQETVQGQLMKWGFVAVIFFIGAGMMSLANRNVYSKDQVDSRDEALRAQLKYMQELQAVQSKHTNQQLTDLKISIQEVKVLIKEHSP